MAEAEIALILRREHIDRKLLKTAWYLHGVASVSTARARYTLARQRQAFLVSAHIFDLALAREDLDEQERLSIGFAAAIGYRRGGRDPNAAAIVSRLRELLGPSSAEPQTEHFETLALRAGIMFLGFETRTAFRWFATWRQYFSGLAVQADASDLRSTILGPSQQLILGTEDILGFLARGDYELFDRGRERLRIVASDEDAGLNERWVGSHLFAFAGEAEMGSPWNPKVLPPEIPTSVRQAFAIGNPAVLTFWEPQRELLTGALSPLDPQVKRMVLAVPTSGGKTLIAQLISVAQLSRSDKSVCFVVPTRSLGREVRRAMSQRVRILEKDVGSEKPDFPIWWEDLDLHMADDAPADVEVMTPERLSHLIRQDASAVLDRFGMFIFDEAQLLKEQGRGFVLESLVASLNLLTAGSDHRIGLVSAAMGNAGAIGQWLSSDGTPLVQQSEWRGPRRLNAVFNTRADWESTVVESGAGPIWQFRHTTRLSGQIRVRLANGKTTSLSTQGDTGWRLVRKSKDGSAFPKDTTTDQSRNTKQYVIASGMVVALGHAGSVLVVAATKRQAQSLARGIADELNEAPALAPLVDYVRQHLGDAHPLVATLRKGVGFHHAGLPVEVLEALEAAVRDDSLPYLTCTSTLTDGVNLPVRTVVLYDAPYPDQPEDSRLRGARLVNAMGRAGRAGRETEGWIVLVRAAEPSEQDFSDLNPDSDELEIRSALITDAALQTAAELEQTARTGHDAVFSARGAAADFVSFVWAMLSTAEHLDDESIALPEALVNSTLAARQSEPARQRYLQIAETTRRAYRASDADARRRWSRVGTSIGSARRIDALAKELAASILLDARSEQLATPSAAVAFLTEAIDELLTLDEAPKWEFRVSPKGAPVVVAPTTLLLDWLSGSSLPELAQRHLSAVKDAAWRVEQIVNVSTEQFEHYLSWTLGALVELTNSLLESYGSDERLCPELAGYVRYGVMTPTALRLMSEGMHSRRISNLIAERLPMVEGMGIDELRGVLGALSMEDWVRDFAATASEVADLLDFTRQRRRSLLKVLLDTGTASLPVVIVDEVIGTGHLSIRRESAHSPLASLGVFEDDRQIARIVSKDSSDIQAILDTGFPLELSIFTRDSEPEIQIRLALDSGSDRLL